MTTNGLFTQLDMGKRALMAQQSGMSTAGHNIANVDNENYTRQRVELEAQHPVNSRFGAGVDTGAVRRVADRFLDRRLIAEQSRNAGMQVREKGLMQLQSVFAEVQGYGLRNALNSFWEAWGRLAAQPEKDILRQNLLGAGKRLAQRISGLHHDFAQMRQELNGRISERVAHANELAGEIASLNARIQQVDHGHGEANDLRDQREKDLKDLSKLVHIDWYENPAKMVMVSIGNGFPLVNGRQANKLEASFVNNQAGMFSLRGLDPHGISRDLTSAIHSGELKEYVNLRDGVVYDFMKKLDELASEIAYRVNALHNSGTGLGSGFRKLTSSFALRPDAVNKPLPFLKNGVFRIELVGPKNQKVETYEIGVQAGKDTVKDIVDRINKTVANPKLLKASLNADGSVTLAAQGPYNLVLGQDGTGFAAMMGFNNFFESLQGARDFHVNSRLVEHPDLISTGKDLLPGDNSTALAINQLQFKPTMDGQTITFDDFYDGMLSRLGLMINRSREEAHNQALIVNQFQKLRDSMSSVNMDEEVADMVQYQRGFEAAAKFVKSVDDMTRTVIDM